MINLEGISDPHIIFSNGIGDHFLVLPTLRALNLLFNEKITLICQKDSLAKLIFCELKSLNFIEIEFIEINGERRFDSNALSKKITNCDFLISLNPWGGSLDIVNLIKKLNNLKGSIGFFKCFDIYVPFDESIHSFDMNFNIITALNNDLKIADFSYPSDVGDNFIDIKNTLSSLIPKDVKILTLQIDTEQEKMWSTTNYIILLNKIMEKYENLIVIPLGINNIEFINSLKYSERILQYENIKLPFNIACAYVSICDFFIGIDSVFLHVADLYRKKSIGIFGPTSHIEFGFRFSKHICHIFSQSQSMDNIKVSDVEEAFDHLYFI